MREAWMWMLVFAALVAVPAACAALLRSARPPGGPMGWSMLGGLFAGMLIGPTIGGRLFPDFSERALDGAVEQRRALDWEIRGHGADLLAAQRVGPDQNQIKELMEKHAQRRTELERQWRDAQWRHQWPLRCFAFLIISATLLAAGRLAIHESDPRQGLLTPLSIGTWSAAFSGVLAYAAMTWWLGFAPAQGAMVAAALAIGPWALSRFDRQAADQVEFGGAAMIQTAGRIASILALAAAMCAMWMQWQTKGLAMSVPLLIFPLGWLKRRKSPRSNEVKTSAFSSAIEGLLVPCLAACLTIKIDIFEHFSLWPFLIVVLLSDDGRWIGAFVGAMLPGGRRALRTLRLVLGSMAAGPTQLAVAAFAAHVNAVPPTVLLPLAIGALMMEFTAPVRRSLARQIALVEDSVQSIDRDQ